MKAAIRQRAIELGFDDCRFTSAEPPQSGAAFQRWLDHGYHGEMTYLQRNVEKRLGPERILPGVRTIICLSASYHRTDAEASAAHSGRIARYAQSRDYHKIILPRLEGLAKFLEQIGGAETRSLGYVDTGPLLERDLAQRAGLGFIGKHTNLVSRTLGNWILLADLLTTLELEPDLPEHNRCGSCSRCLAACPTGAIIAPFQLDGRRCISYLTIELRGPIPVPLRPAIGNRIFGCDDCLAVCPWNRFAQEGRMMKDYERKDLATADLLELLALDEAAFIKRFAGTPVMRTKWRGLIRNVCVALGNTGDETALTALRKAGLSEDPLIAEHAQWAIEQILARAK